MKKTLKPVLVNISRKSNIYREIKIRIEQFSYTVMLEHEHEVPRSCNTTTIYFSRPIGETFRAYGS